MSFDTQTALNNVLVGSIFGAQGRGHPTLRFRPEALESALDALEFCGLLDKQSQPPPLLSVFERKRLMFATASLHVEDGEAVVILGPNGHGKTTLLRAISGLIHPIAGRVELNGRAITQLEPEAIVAAGIIHIPQGDLLFPEMTVLENLLMGAYRSAAWQERNSKLAQIFLLFPGLAERKKQLARSLSGGERRMLALGRGLMGKARLLMIDEPSLGLAPLVIEQVYETIHEIKRTGMAILLMDENANHVTGLADRVYLLEAGVLVREGTADQLLGDAALLSAYLG